MDKYQISIAAEFTLEAADPAAAQALAEDIRRDFSRQTYGAQNNVGRFGVRYLSGPRKDQSLPNLTTLTLPPGWQDSPSYRTGPDYRLLFRLPQNGDPTIEVRLDNRRRKRLRIEPHNCPAHSLVRYGTTLNSIYHEMHYFNALLRDDRRSPLPGLLA